MRLLTFKTKSALSASTVERSIISGSEEISVQPELDITKKAMVEKNAGLFRKITHSNKDFEFGEILTTDDVEEYQKRFQGLKELFPFITEIDLRSLVFISPLLLALETESLQTAVRRLSCDLPYVDPSYLIQQRSCGLDLLVACMSPTFNLELRLNDVKAIIDDRDLIAFIQRVPHSLTPRYLLALQDHCFILNDVLGFSLTKSLNVIENWPGILGIDLKKHLTRFITSLQKQKLLPAKKKDEEKFISNLIYKVPRCLMQDMPRRVQILKQTFPNWNLPGIVRRYPRVLTQKIQGLVWHFETLQELLGPLSVDANDLVHSDPRFISHNPHQILAAANRAAAAFPESSLADICSRAPRMLLLSRSRLLGQIRCLRRDFVQEETHDPIQYDYYNEKSRIKSRTNYIQDFITNDEFGMIEIFTEKEKDFTMSEVDTGNHQKVTIVEKERGVITSEVDGDNHESQSESETQSQDLVDDETRIQVAQILMRMGTTEANDLLAAEYSDIDYENSIFYEDLSEDQNEKEMQIKTLRIKLTSNFHSSISDVDVVKQVEIGAVEGVGSNREQSHDLDSLHDISLKSEGLSVTRLIMGNQDLFIDNYPIFLSKAGRWMKAFGPILAYTVLSAVPSALDKKPIDVHPILKKIFSLILETDIKPNRSFDELNGPLQTLNDKSPVYTALYELLKQAPQLMRRKPEYIDFELQQLAVILQQNDLCPVSTDVWLDKLSSHSNSDPTVITTSAVKLPLMKRAQQLAVGAPRVLLELENNTGRILFRARLLLYFMHRNRKFMASGIKKSDKDLQAFSLVASLLLECPMILSSPSSVLTRLYFTQKYLSHTSSSEYKVCEVIPSSNPHFMGSMTSLTFVEVGKLLDCSPQTFITRLADFSMNTNCLALENSYMQFMEAVIKELTPPVPVISEIPMEDQGEYDGDFEGAGSEILNTDIDNNGHNSNLKSGTIEILRLEMLLCGHFNNFSASSGIISNEKIVKNDYSVSKFIDKNQKGATKNSNKSNESHENVLDIKSEIKRIDNIIQRVDQILTTIDYSS